MKVKIKDKDNLHDVVGFSSKSIRVDTVGVFGTTNIDWMVTPVVLIVLRGTTKVEVHPVQDIEELHK